MILKTYLKSNNIVLNDRLQSHLGINIYRSFNKENPSVILPKVNINSKGVKMNVCDYPRDYFETELFKNVLKRFLKKHNLNKQVI